MLKIGDFSSLSQVSIKTLRYYDQRGLLPPALVDPQSGYRFYSTSQFSRLHRILALRDLGFSLEQIADCLAENVTAEQMRGMLLLLQAEQQARVDDERDRLSRIRSHIWLIEQESAISQDALLKQAPGQWIASVREIIANYQSVGALYPRVFDALGPNMQKMTLCVAIWHDPEFKESSVDAEAGVYLQEPVPASGELRVYELPPCTAASILHRGSYQRIKEAYDALLRWIAANGYQVAGPIRELYLKSSMPVRQDDESYITEIQVPVSRPAA